MTDLKYVPLSDTGELDAPSSCTGNACSKIVLRTTFWPGTQLLKSVAVRNRGTRPANVSFQWGNILGGCGIGTTTNVQDGETETIEIPQEWAALGYCSMSAVFE